MSCKFIFFVSSTTYFAIFYDIERAFPIKIKIRFSSTFYIQILNTKRSDGRFANYLNVAARRPKDYFTIVVDNGFRIGSKFLNHFVNIYLFPKFLVLFLMPISFLNAV